MPEYPNDYGIYDRDDNCACLCRVRLQAFPDCFPGNEMVGSFYKLEEQGVI